MIQSSRSAEDLSLAPNAVSTSEAVAEANDINMAEVPRKWGLITPKDVSIHPFALEKLLI